VRTVGTALAIFLALALQTTFAFSLAGHGAVMDLVLVVVVFVALVAGPVVGLLTGSVAGLAQDALAGGIVGIGGLSKSLVGFLVGVVGTQFIVVGPAHRFVVYFLASLLNAGVFVGLYQVIDPRGFGAAWTAVGTQALVNALVGILAFQVIERGPDWWHRQRMRRSVLRR
jgi:rod shape-determining protein MreD